MQSLRKTDHLPECYKLKIDTEGLVCRLFSF